MDSPATLREETLPDGRRLFLVIGEAPPMPNLPGLINQIRIEAAPLVAAQDPSHNLQLTMYATYPNGARRFIEVDAREPALP